METGLQNSSTKTNSLQPLRPEIIINEQANKEAVIAEISSLLLSIVKLYQIPNVDEITAVMLAEWVFDNYKFERLETIKRTLKNPPDTGQKNWRLTPDTIREWFSIELEKEAIERERISNLYKTKDAEELHSVDIPEHVNQLIEEYKQKLSEPKPIRPISEKEIKEEGRHRPKKPVYNSPGYDYYIQWRTKILQFQERTVRERHPEMNEEQIQARLKELEKTLP